MKANKIVAVVPARSGSRLKDKNIRNLGGKPLMAWVIQAALKSKHLDGVYVSTDSEKYGKIAVDYGAKWIKRPRPLAEDVPTELVIKHALKFIEDTEKAKIDPVATIQPTTPLIFPEDIDACIENYRRNDAADSAMTVYPVSQHPEWMFKIEDGVLKPFMKVPLKGNWGVRQTLSQLYIPNGGVYLTKRSLLIEEDRLIGNKCIPTVMPEIRSIDVDKEEDFALLEAIIKNGLHYR